MGEETETIDKLFLELSQFTNAETGAELLYKDRIAELERELAEANSQKTYWRLRYENGGPEGDKAKLNDLLDAEKDRNDRLQALLQKVGFRVFRANDPELIDEIRTWLAEDREE